MRLIKKMIFIIVFAVVGLSLVGCIVLGQKTFGSKPKGKRLERLKASPQYKNGKFENFSNTPMMSPDASYFKLIKKYIWKKEKTEPDYILPTVKRDLKTPVTNMPTITWFGHSTLLIQIEGKNILIDPVFSERASPFSFVGSKSYPGTRIYSLSDLPHIDFLFLSHDHYDHLDFETIKEIKSKVKKFITPLGVGAHLEYWNVAEDNISELDWWDSLEITQEIKIIAVPARHFSGRGLLDKNKTLWCSYILQTKDYNIYIGGDSGYDTHFKTIGEKYGPFDLAFLECGQYNSYWPYIHMAPEETAQAALDLKAEMLLPVHWGKFTLSLHPWDEPIKRLTIQAQKIGLKITTPLIGEKVVVDSIYPSRQWWLKN